MIQARQLHSLSIIIFMLSCFLSSTAYPAHSESLVEKLQKQQKLQAQKDQQRLEKFLKNKFEQQKLLSEAKQALAQERARGIELARRKEKLLTLRDQLYTQQNELRKTIGPLTHSVRSAMSSTAVAVSNSVLAVENKEFLEKTKELELSSLFPEKSALQSWHLGLLQVLEQSGSVSSLDTAVVQPSGETNQENIVRIGALEALGKSSYLRYDPAQQLLINTSLNIDNARLFSPNTPVIEVPIDVSDGMFLKLLQNRTSLLGRITSGGVIGYCILALGIAALFVALYKLISLQSTLRLVRIQQKNLQNLNGNNPLGRVLLDAQKSLTTLRHDPEALDRVLEDSILRELPPLESGLRGIKLVAAVCPLLGLLGTVVGMIETFHTITSYGSPNITLMAGGISQALVTTMLGLSTSIPLLLLHGVVSGKSALILHILEEQSCGIMSKLITNGRQDTQMKAALG